MLKFSWVDRVDAVDPLSRDTLYPVRREIYPIYPVYPIYPRSGRVICFFNSVIASSSYPHSSQAFSNVTGVGTTTLTPWEFLVSCIEVPRSDLIPNTILPP